MEVGVAGKANTWRSHCSSAVWLRHATPDARHPTALASDAENQSHEGTLCTLLSMIYANLTRILSRVNPITRHYFF